MLFKKVRGHEPSTVIIVGAREINLYPASINSVGGVRWGYINDRGELLIKPIYDQAEAFQSNGLAAVIKEDQTGLINQKGAYVVKPQYDYIMPFQEGLAVAYGDGESVLIDEKGKVYFKNKGYIGNMHEGMATFANYNEKDEWRYGYVDREGKVLLNVQYPSAGDFHEGKAVVEIKENHYALIDKKGKILRSFNYPFVGNLREGLLPFRDKTDGQFGFIDESGHVVIPPQFDGVDWFQKGRAVVSINDQNSFKYGLINKRGVWMIPPRYSYINQIGENRVAVGISVAPNIPMAPYRYAIATTDGNFLTGFILYDVTDYDHGLASANDGKDTFFINIYGRKVKTLPTIRGAGAIQNLDRVIRAMINGRTSYYTPTGQLIWEQNTEIPLNDQYLIRENLYHPNRNYLVRYPTILGMKDLKAQQRVNEELRKMSEIKAIDPENQLDYSYEGGFNVTFFKDDLVVIELWGYNYPLGAAHGMPSQIHTHIDLKSGRFYELKDLFKKDSDYIKVLSDIIRQQIIDQGSDSPVWIDEYKGIKKDQPFFITEDALNIYFNVYEIAPYAAGFPTFTIPFKEIMDEINQQGELWKAFH